MQDETKPILEVGYYHPSPTFLSLREHVCVMDTAIPGDQDGALIALFGPSRPSGATEAEEAESQRQARLFIAAEALAEENKKLKEALKICLFQSRDENRPPSKRLSLIQEYVAKAFAALSEEGVPGHADY